MPKRSWRTSLITPTSHRRFRSAKLWSICGVMAFGRHRETWYLYVDRAEVVAAGEVQGFPVIAAEGDIGGGGSAGGDAGQLLAGRVHDPYSPPPPPKEVALPLPLY